jgi:cytochrome c biogenesis protein CcmG/thiol:disulfide interchange protein DsbE
MRRLTLYSFLILLSVTPALAALKTNDIAPTFSLRDSEGRDFHLGDVVGEARRGKGNGVIVSFFATWCAPCRSELLLINSLVDELKGKGVTVVIVDIKEDFDTIHDLLDELKVDKPIVLSDPDGKIAGEYRIKFLPTTYFIGADGTVKDMIFGEIFDAKELRESARKLLK